MRLGVRTALVLSAIILGMTVLTIHWNKARPKSVSLSVPLAGHRSLQGSSDKQRELSGQASRIHLVNESVLKYPWAQSLLKKDQSTVNSLKQELLEGMIAPNVFILWCGAERWFEFKHYISVLSTLRHVKADKLYFIYDTAEPKIDKMYYNLWYEDLKHDVPFFVVRSMEDWQRVYCAKSSALEKLAVIIRTLNYGGGLFVSDNTWMLNITSAGRLVDLDNGYDMEQMEGFVLMRRGLLTNYTSVEMLLRTQNDKMKKSYCSPVHHVHMAVDLGSCMIVKGGRYQRIWPMDIWQLDDAFGNLSRKLFYGSEEIREPEPSYDSLVPNIGHMVWIGGGRMDFVFYLSVLSLLYVARVETVFIHGDVPPAGEYWQQLKTDHRTKDLVKFMERSPPYEIYQGAIEPWYRALMSDIIRVDLMIKYGGIYTDTDAIWAKPLTMEDRAYDAVASYDWVDWSWPYPDSVNFGISYGKKNAPFWQIFRDSMRTLHNDHHGFTGVMMPYKLLEKYPHLLRIDRHLQVICYYSKCHPIWVNDYHNMSKDHTNMHSMDNWRRDVNAFHWTFPNPEELSNMTMLMQSTSIFADLGRFVLKKAGII